MMSEEQKGDTSSTPPRIVKNPLLSASVTGLTLDDFPNKPLLLPPAAAAPAPIYPVVRESKSLVTVGATSDIDTEKLDEINLNATSEETQPALIDTNDNSLLEQNITSNTDSILSQAASSFSALPSVASSVFSTFSKRIYSGSTSRERTPHADDANANFIPQLEIQPAYIHAAPPQQQLSQEPIQYGTAAPQPLPNFYPSPLAGAYFDSVPVVSAPLHQEPTPVKTTTEPPPKFYTPTEVPIAPAINATLPPPTASGQNTYRLSAKKKIYAPIPGLSEQSQPPPQILPTANATAFDAAQLQSNSGNYPTVNVPFVLQAQEQQQAKQEERKGGIFSLTNLVPTGVLQNLTGLVQSATDTLTQTVKSDPYQPRPQQNPYFEIPQQEINYFGAPQTAAPIQAPIFYPSASENSQASINFFTPPAPLNAALFQPSQSVLQPLNPSQNLPVGQASAQEITLQQQVAPVAVPLPPISGFVPQAANLQNQRSALQSDAATVKPIIFDPLKSLPDNSSTNSSTKDLTFAPPSTATIIADSNASGDQLYLGASATPVFQSTAPYTTSLNPLLPPSTAVPTLSQSSSNPLLPPTIGTNQQLPPKTGQTSYRLQKGTRLYKSPITPAETAPVYVNPPLEQTKSAIQAPHAVYNPYESTATAALNVSTVASPVPTNLEPQSVPLFAPLDTTHSQTPLSDSISLPPVAVETETTNKSVPPNIPVEQTFLAAEPTLSVVDSDSKEQAQENFAVENKPETSLPIAVLDTNLLESQTIEPVLTDTNEQTKTTTTTSAPLQIQDQSLVSDILDEALEKFASATISEQQSTEEPVTDLPPPAHNITANDGHTNPYRKELTPATTSSSQPILANFFAPAQSDNSAAGADFNFFAAPQIQPEVVQPSTNPYFNASSQATTPINFFGDNLQSGSATFEKNNAEPIGLPDLPPLAIIAPPPLSPLPQAETKTEDIEQSVHADIAPPIGFDNIASEVRATSEGKAQTDDLSVAVDSFLSDIPKDTSSVNSFSNYFNQNSTDFPKQQKSSAAILNTVDHTAFFDTFTAAPTTFSADYADATAPPAEIKENLVAEEQQQQQQRTNEDQRIQNFFNNPPSKENSASIGDLNYDLVHSGLAVKRLQTRSLTPASNLVEPPSSSCSEFSELNNSLAGQRAAVGLDKSAVAAENTNKNNNETSVLSSTELAKHYEELPEEILRELRMSNSLQGDKISPTAQLTRITYKPAVKHWFYKRPMGTKYLWTPFSHYDSALLETSLTSAVDAPNHVAVEGGRYDVNISERTKSPVYWEGENIEVRRCSWFYKGTDSKYVPYEEDTADLLEVEYKQASDSGEWHKKIILSMGEQVVFHGPTVIVHFQQQQNTDAWGGSTQTTTRPRVVKRDLEDFVIEQGESQRVDHLLFMVHGIGAACDLKMRTVEEVVEEFRSIAHQLVQSHYKNSTEMGVVGRVEVLPISWHGHLHSEEMGIDEKLKSITLESIPKLRNFTNDTLLDVLFYTSPTYCQQIMNRVAASMNAVYLKYRERHPDFSGGVSLAGHSLGSLILFDLLCHQNPIKECEEQNMENPDQQFLPQSSGSNILDSNQASRISCEEVAAKHIRYTMGPAGTGQPFIHYAQLIFQPKKFFALGSPIGMFVTIRGIDKLGLDFRLPTCPGFYNIFHPFDPVAYRIEALVNPDMSGIRPVLIPHHKGRKRMHLELKETMSRVGADLKQRFFDTFKTTLESVNFLGTSTKSKKETEETMEKEVDKVLQMQIQFEQQQPQHEHVQPSTSQYTRSRASSTSTNHSDADMVEIDFPLGKLNDSKRVDYVLQEAPLEFFNEYLFALSSHVCYWDSEDTILFVMKEIYSGLGISPDSQVPQQSMTIERPNTRESVSQSLLPPTI